MTSQKLNEEHEILRRFMAVVVSSAFKNYLINCRSNKRPVGNFGDADLRWAKSPMANR